MLEKQGIGNLLRMFQVPLDGFISQRIEGAVNARRLAPGHSEFFANVVDASGAGPIPLQKRIERLPGQGVVLTAPINPPGLVCIESERNPLPRGVLALADTFSLLCVVTERMVSIAAQVGL